MDNREEFRDEELEEAREELERELEEYRIRVHDELHREPEKHLKRTVFTTTVVTIVFALLIGLGAYATIQANRAEQAREELTDARLDYQQARLALASEQARLAAKNASLNRKLSYRGCLQRNKIAATVSLLVIATLNRPVTQLQTEEQRQRRRAFDNVFRDALKDLRSEDCLAIRRGAARK